MNKTCIFCGKKAKCKTKEHIIPKWLIKLTDHEERKTYFGTNLKGKIISFPFMRFVFPACQNCNEFYSRLEAKVALIIKKILHQKKINQIEIIDLLDWFDKIRIGLWIGLSMLKGIKLNPTFHITQRIGVSDRMIMIYRSIENTKGIVFSGTETLAFLRSPSCFSLRINDLTFVNYSNAFLLSKNMGFPYPTKLKLHTNGKLEINGIHDGDGKVTLPILEKKRPEPAIEIYQVILSEIGKVVNNHTSNYLFENSMPCKGLKLISKPYVIDDFLSYSGFVNSKTAFKIKKRYKIKKLKDKTALIVLKYQNDEIDRALKLVKYLPKKLMEHNIYLCNESKKMNNALIKKIENRVVKIIFPLNNL